MPDREVAERVFALVPVKRFTRAKSRLAGALDPAERELFARSLCEHVLSVLVAAPGLAGVLVVTDDDEVAETARARGAAAIPDGAEGPLGAVIDAALVRLVERGATAALVLMADLPALAAGDVEAMLDRFARRDLVIAPDEDDEGTNALLLRLPARGPTRFGTGDSFRRHLADAQAAGVAAAIVRTAGLAFDVDGPRALKRAQRFRLDRTREPGKPRGCG